MTRKYTPKKYKSSLRETNEVWKKRMIRRLTYFFCNQIFVFKSNLVVADNVLIISKFQIILRRALASKYYLFVFKKLPFQLG